MIAAHILTCKSMPPSGKQYNCAQETEKLRCWGVSTWWELAQKYWALNPVLAIFQLESLRVSDAGLAALSTISIKLRTKEQFTMKQCDSLLGFKIIDAAHFCEAGEEKPFNWSTWHFKTSHTAKKCCFDTNLECCKLYDPFPRILDPAWFCHASSHKKRCSTI